MKTLLNKVLRLFLSEQKIWELKNRYHITSMEWTLLNVKKLGYFPLFAVDAGAFDGGWTMMFKKIFPSANVLMIEVQQDKADALEVVSGTLPGTRYHIGLLGSASGKEAVFHINETVSSVLEE
ncbi:hypothetical protein [Mucilaginibacter flavidus]|uniref:hypothetical protein n=1 Tax=Mucilaginibacter flavidus TaxID=2949309 RepID=UPI0020932F87|nr:hypothetical protein [Mucilaginibacter flavidus]MCO5947685.1 hypothetical protein [Mucilaginibacter flavidus]